MSKFTVNDYLDNKSPNKNDEGIVVSHQDSTKVKGWQVGRYLSKIYGKTKTYKAVDLSQAQVASEIFKRQNHQMGQHLFGSKGAVVQNLAGRLISDEQKHTITTTLYDTLAQFAKAWAKHSLAKRPEFAQIATLSPAQKEAFADTVTARNRALVSVGAVAGFWGLKGVVADSVWFLLVSLKSVYELALIYNRPLTNKESLHLAYGILAESNLNKLQEKQIVMTALATSKTLFTPMAKTNLNEQLKDQLQAVIKDKQIDDSFLAINEVFNHLNLNQLTSKNHHWLTSILSITTSLVSVHYNNILLEEVLGVAKATLKEKMRLLDNQTT